MAPAFSTVAKGSPKKPQSHSKLAPRLPQHCLRSSQPEVSDSCRNMLRSSCSTSSATHSPQPGPAECAVAIKSAAALHRLACETIFIPGWKGWRPPLPPHLLWHAPSAHSQLCVFLMFYNYICAKHVNSPRASYGVTTVRRPPRSHSGLPSQKCEALHTHTHTHTVVSAVCR